MIFHFKHNHKSYSFDSENYIDLSVPIKDGDQNVNAYHIGQPKFTPFCIGDFVGSVAQGGACNCETITFNAHGNGTHTEGIGHITSERIPIYETLKQTHCIARLITIAPTSDGDDKVIALNVFQGIDLAGIDALVLRTQPNSTAKQLAKYSGSNPIYLLPEVTRFLADNNIKHLLLDMPSVDKEEDGGALEAHKAFWNYPRAPRMDATITEMIYVPNSVEDGLYMLNIQIASFHSDASPSRPLLFELTVQ